MPPTRQPELYAAAIIPYIAAATALVLRVIARRKTRMPIVWEDYLAVIAFAIGSGFTFLSLYKMRWGLGMHMADVQLPQNEITYHYFLDLWVDMWLYTFSVGLSKLVILGFYWRMFSTSVIRQPIRILFACSVGWIITRVTLIFLQCRPIHLFWTRKGPGGCNLPPMLFLFGAGIPHFVLEVAILICPLIEIRRLHLPLSKKLAVAAMFASGFLVCCSAMGSVVHTVALNNKHTDTDLTWDSIDDQIWAVCDVNLASFATSLPLLRPVFRSLGGIFSFLKSTPSQSQTYANQQRVPTYTNMASRRTRTHGNSGAESVIELTDAAGHIAGRTPSAVSSKAYALHNSSHGSSDIETQSGIHIQKEMVVKYGDA